MNLSKNNVPLELSLLDHYKNKKDELYYSCHPKVKEAREVGIAQLKKMRLPITGTEKWRNTNLHKLFEQEFYTL